MKARKSSGIDASIFRRTISPEAALFQARLELAHQVFGLFLDFDVAVADDAERALRFDVIAREELVQEQRDRVFKREEAALRALARREIASADAPASHR